VFTPKEAAVVTPNSDTPYSFARFALPPGSALTLHCTYPYTRYHKFALYKAERNTFVSINEALAAQEIEPDPGSTNPYRVGAERLAERRNYTLRIVARDPPSDPSWREKIILYAGQVGGELEAVLRVYLADQNRDGAGWGLASLPFTGRGCRLNEGTLADGTKLSADAVIKQFVRPIVGNTQQPLTSEQWTGLIHGQDNDLNLDPATAPARNPPRWEKFSGLSTVLPVHSSRRRNEPEYRSRPPWKAVATRRHNTCLSTCRASLALSM
jgi:hypothetical protein